MPETAELTELRDLWDEQQARSLGNNQLALLRYRSNLLGADLRITNFGGGNTSSKFELPDPFSGAPVRVLAVKGSGGDIGSITESGFAILYLERLEQLKNLEFFINSIHVMAGATALEDGPAPEHVPPARTRNRRRSSFITRAGCLHQG